MYKPSTPQIKDPNFFVNEGISFLKCGVIIGYHKEKTTIYHQYTPSEFRCEWKKWGAKGLYSCMKKFERDMIGKKLEEQ